MACRPDPHPLLLTSSHVLSLYHHFHKLPELRGVSSLLQSHLQSHHHLPNHGPNLRSCINRNPRSHWRHSISSRDNRPSLRLYLSFVPSSGRLRNPSNRLFLLSNHTVGTPCNTPPTESRSPGVSVVRWFLVLCCRGTSCCLCFRKKRRSSRRIPPRATAVPRVSGVRQELEVRRRV
jgi:hypothetical protein